MSDVHYVHETKHRKKDKQVPRRDTPPVPRDDVVTHQQPDPVVTPTEGGRIAPLEVADRDGDERAREEAARIEQAAIESVAKRVAQAIQATGALKVTGKLLKPGTFKSYGITERGDVARAKALRIETVQQHLDQLWNDAGPRKVVAQRDVTAPEQRPTGRQGMDETDATALARLFDWEEISTNFDCSDPPHSPKGRLYFDRARGQYYGADNSGHVGWGFKVWKKKDKTTLDYAGNISWKQDGWTHDARGTKRGKEILVWTE